MRYGHLCCSSQYPCDNSSHNNRKLEKCSASLTERCELELLGNANSFVSLAKKTLQACYVSRSMGHTPAHNLLVTDEIV